MSKKIVFVAVMLLFGATTAFSQNSTFTTEAIGKAIPGSFGSQISGAFDQQFIGATNKAVVLFEYSGLGRAKQSLASYDYSQNELGRVDMGTIKDFNCYGGFINDGNVDLLFVNNNDDGLRVWRERRTTTLAMQGEQVVLADYKGQKGDEFFFSMGTSADQQLLAGVYVAARKTQDAEVKVALYNRELSEYWKVKVDCFGFNQVFVTDSGEVVLAYFTDKGKCLFTIADGENEEHCGFSLADDVRTKETRLIRYGDGKLLVAVAVQEDERNWMPAKEAGPNIDRIDFYCYDVKSGKLTVTQHNFTDLEVARLTNEKESGSMKYHWVPFGNLQQGIADATGAYLVIDQMWTVYVDGLPSGFHRRGMMVMRVSADGKVEWTRTWRFDNICSPNYRGCLGYRWQPCNDGIMLAMPNSVKNSTLPAEKPVKKFVATRDKAVLSVIRLSADGKERSENFNIDKQSLIGSAHHLDGNKYLLLLSNKKQGQFAHLELK